MAAPKGNKYALGNKGGRPSLYSPELCDKVDEYLAQCKDRYHENGKLKVNIPTFSGFSLFVDIPLATMKEWIHKHYEFSTSIDKIKKEQEARLLNSGLSGEYNPTIAKLMLSNNHGYVERREQKTTHMLKNPAEATDAELLQMVNG